MNSAHKAGWAVLSFLIALPAAGLATAQDNAIAGDPNAAEDRFWTSAEYLYWFRDKRSIPPMVTRSPLVTPRADAGVLGKPGTRILLGHEDIGGGGSSGARATLGAWFDDRARLGAGLSVFGLERERMSFSFRSDGSGSPILAVPFHDAQSGQEQSVLLGYPGTAGPGSVHIDTTNELYGGDLFLRWNFARGGGWRWDALVGYSFSRIEDGLSLTTRTAAAAGGFIPAGTTFSTKDDFDVRNDFHALGLGLQGEYRKDRWVISGLGRLRLGDVHQRAEIHGRTGVAIPGGGTSAYPGGLFAQATNSGVYTQDKFAFVPEAQLSVGYQITRNLRLSVGYGVAWWNSVALAGEQLDRTLNTSQFPPGALVGPARPSFSSHETGFLVHGFFASLMLEF